MKETQMIKYGAVLKKYRGLAGLSQTELGRLMQVSRNTVINWENGSHQPDMDTIRLLCRKLRIPVSELFSLSEKTLAEDEAGLLSAYRDLSPNGKLYAREAVYGMRRAEEKERTEKIRRLFLPVREYHTAPAAGAGNLFNSLLPTLRFVKRTAASAKADAIVMVDGRSMEPLYHSGDYVYFRYAHDASPGDIVICSTADGAVIKAVDGNRRLYSLNPEFPYGEKGEDDSVIVQGKVLGIVRPEDLPTEEESALISEIFSEEIENFEREYE